MTEEIKIRLAEGGRIVIPAEYREALGIRPGDEVILRLEEGQARILVPKQPPNEPRP